MIGHRLKLLWDVCCLNTLLFNFKYLPLSKAVMLPIWVSRRVRIRNLGGKIIINGDIYTGMIRIGLDSVGIFDNKKSRSIWQVNGQVIFNGRCFLGHGCKVSVGEQATLSFGSDFACTAESSIATVKSISIGDECLFSWDILMMDTDWHTITDLDGKVQNPPKPIRIGNRVWVGCRATITKGVSIADGTIIAAGSIVSKDVTESNSIVGKNPLQVIRRNILWHK